MLAPVSALYGALTRARLALYKTGALAVHRIDAPVISVGNITAGGTGKTPLVARIARILASRGLRVCILTRGYGRSDPKARVVVSDGENILADALEGGDEPRMLAEMLSGQAAVVSDRDRVAAARWARSNLDSELFILDDGFQHLRMWRDLNIVLIDALDPWGGNRLLPRGLLREPRRNLSRADCIVVSRAAQAAGIETLLNEIKDLSGGRPVFISRVTNQRVRPLKGMDELEEDGSFKPSCPVAAFCGTGNPQAFFVQLGQDGYDTRLTRAFPDHHRYSQADVDRLLREATATGAEALLTTAKDAVKLGELSFALPCFVLEIELGLDDENGFSLLLDEVIRAAARGATESFESLR
jgi:tetraacyldisaccharide 4'-kinase